MFFSKHGKKMKVDVPLDPEDYEWVQELAESEGAGMATIIRRLVRAARRAATKRTPPTPRRKRGG